MSERVHISRHQAPRPTSATRPETGDLCVQAPCDRAKPCRSASVRGRVRDRCLLHGGSCSYIGSLVRRIQNCRAAISGGVRRPAFCVGAEWMSRPHRFRPGLRCGAVDLASHMTIILVMSDVLPLAEVKAKFSEMIDRVEKQHARITVTRNGRPAAVLMSADDLAALEDTLELLSDPTAMAEIDQARREVVAGNTVSADEIRAKYLRQ